MYINRLDLDPEMQDKLEHLKNDPVYFYDTFFRYPDENLYSYQKEWLMDIANPMYKEYAILKGRQIGASWVFGLASMWYAMMNDESEVKCVSFNLDQAQKILGYAKNFGSRLKVRGWYDLIIEGQRGTDMRFNNTSLIEALGCTLPDGRNVRGHRAHILFIDEADYIYERMFPSIEPLTLHTGGKTIYLSTAGRVGSHFWKKWDMGNKAEEMRRQLKEGINLDIDPDTIPPIKSYTVPSTECPDLTEQDLQRLHRSLGDLGYNREALCIFAGMADQVFPNIPMYDERKLPTRTTKSCFAGIDVGKINDPTVLVVIEAHFAEINAIIDGFITPVNVPYRVIQIKTWEQEHPRDIAADIATSIAPRFNSLLYSIDATAGHGDQLMHYMTEMELPIRGIDVKMKGKNELMLGSASMEGLQDAFAGEQLWINGNSRDIDSQELLFQLGGYIGKIQKGTGYYTFDSTVGRDHAVDACALAWSSVAAGSFKPYITIRKRQ